MKEGRGECLVNRVGGMEERGNGVLGGEGCAHNVVGLRLRDSEIRHDVTFGQTVRWEASTSVVE